jgi:type IV fimbrial biogenesis protein FimT
MGREMPEDLHVMRQTRKTRGFTLVELMVTVVVIGILMSVGIPAFLGMIRGNAVLVASNQALGAVLLARSEAVKREANVNFSTITGGWRVTTTGGTELLRHTVDNANISINTAGAVASGVVFNSGGRSTVALGVNDFLRITIAGLAANDGGERLICFSPTGRPRIESGGSCL